MLSPNFTKSQSYMTYVLDNTRYDVNSTTLSPMGYLWSFAPVGALPGYGQFPNPNTMNNTPSLIRLTLQAAGGQGSTVQQMTLGVNLFTTFTGIIIPATLFAPGVVFNMKAVIELIVQPSGIFLANVVAITNSGSGGGIGGAATISNFTVGAAAMQAGGTIQWVSSFGAVATSPSVSSFANYIEIYPQ